MVDVAVTADDGLDSGRIPGGAGSQCPGGSRRCRMAGGAPGRPGERAEPVPGQQGVRLCLPAASGPAASASDAFPATSVSSMSRALAVIQRNVAPGHDPVQRLLRQPPVTRTGGRVRPAARLPAPAGARPGHPAGTARSQPYSQRRAHRVLDVCILEPVSVLASSSAMNTTVPCSPRAVADRTR